MERKKTSEILCFLPIQYSVLWNAYCLGRHGNNTGLVFYLIRVALHWCGWLLSLAYKICLCYVHGLKVFGWMEEYASNISKVLYGLGIGGIWDMPIGFTAQQGDR